VSPGGHLVTTLGACAAAAAVTGSASLTAGIAVGGFLIDVDHAVDYVLFDGQRDLRPSAFLRYYVESRMRRTVLVLHSYELFALLGVLAIWIDALPLWGYLLGALMHLALDITFNGEVTPRSISAFYSFSYRLAHRFDARALLGIEPRVENTPFWKSFFRGSSPYQAAPPPAPDADGVEPLSPPRT
jgi:hypothetical protein